MVRIRIRFIVSKMRLVSTNFILLALIAFFSGGRDLKFFSDIIIAIAEFVAQSYESRQFNFRKNHRDLEFDG